MKKLLWTVIVIGILLLMGAVVPAQEANSPTMSQPMQGMGRMMGMMGGERQGPMGQMGSMMQMMQMMHGTTPMMETCAQMMGETAPAAPEAQK
jgi:hypothetical protein